MVNKKNKKMIELVETLNRASKAYYQDGKEIMSNYEYDRLYDELVDLENSTGITLSKSPTIHVGYQVLSQLPKEKHPSKMLSLDKTKEVDQLKEWLKEKEGLLSWKLDGLTIVLTYQEGRLVKAVTRGDGERGEVITANAKVFANIPLSIAFKGTLVLRGEAVIAYADFEKINKEIPEESAKYKNPRNLCAGSVRQLNSEITAERHVQFFAFSLVSAEGISFSLRSEQLDWLSNQGFQVVEHKQVTASNLNEQVEGFKKNIESNPIPSDGLVLVLDDIEYGLSLGTTAKFPRDAIAFKWRDEIRETHLQEIEWSTSRTGLINPIAIFEAVELEGTTVTRASVHNISVMEDLKLGIGDLIRVYKANMIIPQIAENLTKSDNVEIPKFCPACGENTKVKDEKGVKTLVCINSKCPAKEIKAFSHFVSRDALNIDGLSEMTIIKLINHGLLKDLADIFELEKHKDTIVTLEGFGEKSFQNLVQAIHRGKHPTTAAFLYGLGIPNIGKTNGALISTYCENKWEKVRNLTEEELLKINGVGEVMAKSYVDFFKDESKQLLIGKILEQITLDEAFHENEETLKGLIFVITGSLSTFPNRDALKKKIEEKGGKVSSSVSAKTDYLINNDSESQTGKNKKAKVLGIPIISEDEMIEFLEKGV